MKTYLFSIACRSDHIVHLDSKAALHMHSVNSQPSRINRNELGLRVPVTTHIYPFLLV